MHQTMNKVAVCVLLFLSVFVSRSQAKSLRTRRSESIDFDKLSDDDVFALLEKPDDYEFQTEKDIEFNFDKIGEGDGEDVTTQSSTTQSFTNTTTELHHEALPPNVSGYEGQPSLSTIPEVFAISYGSSSYVSKFPSTDNQLSSGDASTSQSPNYSTKKDSSTPAETDVPHTTLSPIMSTDVSSVDMVTNEIVLETTDGASSASFTNTTTELHHEALPASVSGYEGQPSLSTIPEVVTISYGSSSYVSEFPSTDNQLSSVDASFSQSPNYSTKTDSSTPAETDDPHTTLSPIMSTDVSSVDMVTNEIVLETTDGASSASFTNTTTELHHEALPASVSGYEGQPSLSTIPEVVTISYGSSSYVSEFPSTDNQLSSGDASFSQSPNYSTKTDSSTPAETDGPHTTLSPIVSTDISSVDMVTNEIVLETTGGASSASRLNTLDIVRSGTTAETGDPTDSTLIYATPELFTEFSLTTSDNTSCTEITLPKTPISSTPVNSLSTTTKATTFQSSTVTQKTLAILSITTERITASTKVKSKPTKTTRKPTKVVKKTTAKMLKTKTKPYIQTTFYPKRKFTPKLAKIVTTKTSAPQLLTILSTIKPMTSSAKITTSRSPSSTAKPAVPPYVVPSSNMSDTGPICFKLLKPDNTLSDDCFFPMGIYPVGEQTSSPITTMRRVPTTSSSTTTTTESTTSKRTEKPTMKRAEGGICFMRVNSANKSECFYLDVNPSEAPRTETIATLAPHRIFEITEEPPPLPVEPVSLLKLPVLNKQKPVGPGSDASTFAPDRIFEIPISGVDQKPKPRKPYNNTPYVPTEANSIPRKFFIVGDDRRNSPGKTYAQGGVDLRRVAPGISGIPEGNHQDSVKNPLILASGRHVVRFQPRSRPDSPSQNERPKDNRYSHGVVDNRGAYHTRGYPVAGQNIDGQGGSSGNRSVLSLHWGPPGRHQQEVVNGDESQMNKRLPSGQAPLVNGRVAISANSRRIQYPTTNLDEPAPNWPPLMLVPVNPVYNQDIMVSNVRVNARLPQDGNNHQSYADDRRTQQAFLIPVERRTGEPDVSNIRLQLPQRGTFSQHAYVSSSDPQFHSNAGDRRTYYPTKHLSGSAPNRPIVLIPVNPGYNQDARSSNVRVNAPLPQDGNNHQSYADDDRQHAFLLPAKSRTGEPGVSNIRIQVPQQGKFSQRASVSSSDPQRSAFEHLYLDVHNGRPYEHYSRSRHRRASKGRPIEETEAISLAFVVDTTASMRTELNEVKSYVSIIMDEVLNNRGSHIGNFIFVPIHDEIPMHERFVVTRDRKEMARTISKINVYGGGTCPENSLIGLLKAIELAEKDSHIFLFTDAFAKDYYLVPDIIKMIQRKKPRVYFLLTGECKDAESNSQRYAFDYIAAASTGIVARLDINKTQSTSTKLQKELHAVLQAVAREFEKNRRIVTEHEGTATGPDPKNIKISVDPGLTNLSLTSTGHNTKIDVVGPRGRPKDIVKVLDMPNIQILSVPKPDPGEWTVSVISPESPFKFVASGISTTDFLYGFSVTPTNDTSRLSKHPMQGVKNHLLLVAKDPSVLRNISNVQLVVGNRVFTTLPITVINKERGIFSGGPILFPDESFKIRINAFTKEGYPLTRLTKATIIPQMPGPPEIDCKKNMAATAGFPFNMTCSVESLIQMDIQMYKAGNEYAHTLSYSQTSTVVLHFDQLKKKDEGNYIIQANNSAGVAYQNIYLEVHAMAPTVYLKPEFLGYPGKRLVIKCDVTSNLDYTVRWMKKDAPSDNFYRSGAFSLLENAELRIDHDKVVIDPVRPDDEGWYICMAKNEGGEKSAHSYLTIQEEPGVSVDTFDEYFQKGDRISIVCRAEKGIPAVSLSWYDNYGVVVKPGSDISTNKRVTRRRDGSLELFINGANKKDVGTYTCLGENPAGRDSKAAVLQYAEMPKVEARETRVQALMGESLTLECSGAGHPAPNITWSRITAGSSRRTPVESNRKDSPGKYLEIEAVDHRDSGTYICTATNPGGSDEDWIEVVIGEKPHIHRLKKQHDANIYHPAELFCGASGVPDPVITWFRVRPDGTSIPVRENTVDGVLRIDNTQLEDGGPYVCLAQNPFGRAESSTDLVVLGAVRPQILKTGEMEVVKSVASRTVNLMCSVTESVPPPTIRWYFKGRPVQDFAGMIVSKEDGTLTITNFHSDLSGNYTCVAENPAGNDTKTVFLKLFDVPVIEALPSTKSIVEGERFSIACQASGDPVPKITWHKQDDRLLSETKELLIERVQVSDAGKYICRAKNVAGIDQTDFNLKILTLPQIAEWEEFKYVKKGEIVRLHCDAKGNPSPKISWLKNNETVRRISIEHYRFEASIYSAGVYSCIARNDVGESRVDTNVIVLVTPLIQDIAEVTEVVAGDPADLKCSAIGNPYPSLSWQFRGETLVKQDVGNDSAVLHIQHVSESDAGTYFCLANSSVGYDRRNTTLKVLQKPKVKCSDAIFRVVPYEKTEIHCDVSAIPPASVIWYKEGRRFGYVRDDGTLEFVAHPEDSGPLKMVAGNKAGSAEQIVNLIVLQPPSFSSPSTSIEALVGTNISLPCVAQGDPKPDITWEQYNYPVPPNKLVFNPASGELWILNVELGDDGSYTCTAKNRVGYSSHTVLLSVLSRPKAQIMSWDLKDGVIREGRELTLICDVSGKPTPGVTWTKDEFPISESNFIRSPNKLKLVTTSDSTGLYSCTAKNAVGQETSSIYVNVTTKPSIDHSEDQFITELEGRSLELKCVAHGNPFPLVTWLQNGTALKVFPDFRVDSDKLVISNLSTNMEGAFTCKASNYLGVEEKLFRVTVNSVPVIRTKVPEAISLYQFDDYAIPCKADGKPTPHIYWKMRDEQYNPGSRSDGEKFIVRNDGTLLIKNVTIEDVGKYKCFAENVNGQSSKSHEIEVIVPSNVDPSAAVATVQERASKRLMCPYGKGAWLKNGEPLDTSNPRGDDPHYSLKEGGKVLLISDASDSDFAVFSCESSDGLRHDFNVKVLSRPAMYQIPIEDEEYLVSDGNHLVVNCSAKGYPDPRVAWHKADPTFGWTPFTNYTIDGVNFSGAQNEILSISEVRLRHNGTYRCTTRNDQGKDARVFSIKWSGPPQLKGKPMVTKKIAVDKPLELSCEMQGTPDPSYSWEFLRSGGPEIQVPEILHLKENTLVIDRVSSKHSGQYTCEASNEAGSEVQTFDVIVIEAPELTRTSITSLTYKTFEDIELNCTSRSPEDEVYWMKDGIFLIKSDRVTLRSVRNPNGTTSHNLRVVNASREDTGTYKCFVSNIAGEAQQLFNVNVIVPPQVIPASSNVEVELGRPLTFNCSITSDSEREVVWIKDGQPLGDDKILEDEVFVDVTTKDDGGEYICVVTNDGGALSVTKYVKILVPPRILDLGLPPGPDLTLKAGDKLELGCVAEGDPQPTLSWSMNGRNLNNGTSDNFWVSADGSKLVKENVTEDDTGDYSCFAVSKVSPPADRYYYVLVYAVPEDHFPNGTYSSYTVQYNHSLDLACPLSDFTNQISWYKSNQRLNENSLPHIQIKPDLSMMKISYASPEDGGVYSCRIEGNYTVKVYTLSVIVTVPYQWSNWTEWAACSHTCGFGEQSRTRSCIPPPALPSLHSKQFVRLVNDSCFGLSKERRRCENSPCPIDGGLSEWSSWEECSASCGNGVQRRYRRCDEPLPSEGGRPCTDPLVEEKECSREPCPVHGGWSEWSEWSGCSASCGYSVKYRDRLCNNPLPSHSGDYCEGSERRQEEACEKPSCPGEGIWSEWSAWSNCSRPCGTFGFKRRSRICLNKLCDHYEKNTERKRCIVGEDVRPCRRKLPTRFPRSIELLVNGLLNGQPIVDNKVFVIAHRNGSIALNSTNHLKMKDAWFPYMNFLVPPVTWNIAEEDGDSTNGYSLSQGKFKQITHFSFSTGELLKVESIGKGLDFGRNQKLNISVNILGSTPEAMLNEAIKISPYDDNLVQRGDNLLNSGSSGEILLNGDPIVYTWNSTIELSEHPKKGISYPVENVKTDNIVVRYDDASDTIWYSSSSTISYKLRDKNCPEGFTLDSAKDHCEDVDECKQGHKCRYTQLCKNIVGSFECHCPDGLAWDSTTNMCQVSDHVEPAPLNAPAMTLSCVPGFERVGVHCQDIDECDTLQSPCPLGELCKNTQGSYQCIPSPCYHTAALRLSDGTCLTWCNGSFACESGAAISEIFKTFYVQLQVVESYREIARLVVPFMSDDSYTTFTISSSNKDLEFRIRHEVDYDVLYSMTESIAPESLTVKVVAIVYNVEGETESTGEFTVHIVNDQKYSKKKAKRKRRNRS